MRKNIHRLSITALTEKDALQHHINELKQRQASLAAHCWSLEHNEENGQ